MSQTTNPSIASEPAGVSGGASAPIMVSASGLTKDFRIYKRPSDRLMEWASAGRLIRHTSFRAVDGVSFQLEQGKCLGVVGANGAGKSTLLKMLTGVLRPTAGSFHVQGRVLSLLELSAGLDPDMTGRENVRSMATLLNFPGEFALKKSREVQDFADLGDFFDRPVRVYSSGMRARLGFSMYACFRPDVFIVDEVLSVGDVFFRQKCARRMRELLDEGMTMLFVSHDSQAVLNLCDEAILLQSGRVTFHGSPEETIRRHVSSQEYGSKARRQAIRKAVPSSIGATPKEQSIIARDVIGSRATHRHGLGEARIVACRVTNGTNHDVLSTPQDGKLKFHLLIESDRVVEQPSVGLQLYDRLNNLVFASATVHVGHKLPPLMPGRRMCVHLTVTMSVRIGPYTFGLSLAEPSATRGTGSAFLDCIDGLGPLEVHAVDERGPRFFGAARLPMSAHHTLTEPSTPGGNGSPKEPEGDADQGVADGPVRTTGQGNG